MSSKFPEEEESEAAREGTAAHELAELMVHSGLTLVAEEWVGKPSSNGVIYTEMMFDGAVLYAEDFLGVMMATGATELGTETRIEAKKVHRDSFGTTDGWLFHRSANVLYIWDYKFGFGVVEAYENWQGINYASGLMDMLGIDGLTDQFLTVKIRIVQPRAIHRDGPIREWSVGAASLRNYVNILNNNAQLALGPNAVCHSGAHCKNCSARHACEAAIAAGVQLYEVASQPVPMELSPQAMSLQLALVRRAIKQLEFIEAGLAAQIEATLRKGNPIPGWTLEGGFGHFEWTIPAEEVIALGQQYGKNLQKPPAVITPTQARKLGVDPAILAQVSQRPNTGLKLTPVENKAKKVFQ